MSDWLERELARGLTKVPVPDALGERLGLVRPRQRSEVRGAFLAVAAAVFVIVAGGYAASQPALDLYRFTAHDAAAGRPIELASARTVSLVSWNPREGNPREGANRPLSCDGGAGVSVPLRRGNTTALVAHHAGSEERMPSAGDAGCGFCHSL
ncbi:MAG: hypothetical protein ABI759_27205 [Candidatus Solibacter sp.]